MRAYGRYGYRLIAAMLETAGWAVNVKRVERNWRQEGLKVPANLVLSCQHCNQSRRQLIHQPGHDEETIARELLEKRLRTTGMKNRFPVIGNAWVTDHEADIGTEAPLLVDPTIN